MRPGTSRLSIAAASTAAFLVVAGAATFADPPPASFHRDPAAVERAILEATRAGLYDDLPAVDAALVRLREASPVLAGRDDAERFRPLAASDRAFQLTIDAARDYVHRNDAKKVFDQVQWIQRACRVCHENARSAGLLKTSSPGDSGSPTRSSGSRP